MEESELDEDEKSENGEEEANEDEEEDNESEEESEKAMSFLEKRRLNKMKLAGQMSNLLVSARSKMKRIAEKLEKPKLEFNPNPRKRKRSVLIDQSTRELIKEITPVRRSSRQVERKFYTEGVTDPELIKLLNKLENYVRLNGKFKPSQDESCYEEDFLGFKQDASRRALYPEDYNPKRRRYRRVVHRSGRSVPVPAMDPSEITDDVLSKVVTHVSAKVYSQTGSTCHQCRQKTLDTKTFCRSGVCTGVRGQFCGVCLLNRYGEDIVKTLLDEKWACPPCRDICNCSICRNRKGLPPTGIMTPFALGKGFDSVKDYLKEAEKDLEFEEY
uniref:Cell division cycle-associated 7-like protein n=1 Tax=Cacopsylla melanoneura TaxID=428564 RepID=A0A8D8VSU6_9HEMI